jgi:hypothetical protein
LKDNPFGQKNIYTNYQNKNKLTSYSGTDFRKRKKPKKNNSFSKIKRIPKPRENVYYITMTTDERKEVAF